MTAATASESRLSAFRRRMRWQDIVLWAGLTACTLPTFFKIASQSWTAEQGQQGPIVLAIGAWLLFRSWPSMSAQAKPGSPVILSVAGFTAAAIYILGRIAGQYLIESFALYLLWMSIIYGLVGFRAMARNWFPLVYLIFALPMPYFFTWAISSHLRLWISQAAVALLHACGLSIVRDGLTIVVDQYAIEVREACSGMNSLFSLSAICLFYIYIRRSPRSLYYVIMALPIVGFAILANFVRVLILVLLTHFYGDAVAQGFLHETAGFATFLVALCGIVAFDHFTAPLARPRGVLR